MNPGLRDMQGFLPTALRDIHKEDFFRNSLATHSSCLSANPLQTGAINDQLSRLPALVLPLWSSCMRK